jgi:hypothetical protein
MDRTWQSAEYDSWFVPYHHDQVDHHHREHKKSTLCFTLCTIMTLLLPLLTLYTLLHEFWCGKVRVAKWQNKVCTWRGKTNEHTPRVPLSIPGCLIMTRSNRWLPWNGLAGNGLQYTCCTPLYLVCPITRQLKRPKCPLRCADSCSSNVFRRASTCKKMRIKCIMRIIENP